MIFRVGKDRLMFCLSNREEAQGVCADQVMLIKPESGTNKKEII